MAIWHSASKPIHIHAGRSEPTELDGALVAGENIRLHENSKKTDSVTPACAAIQKVVGLLSKYERGVSCLLPLEIVELFHSKQTGMSTFEGAFLAALSKTHP